MNASDTSSLLTRARVLDVSILPRINFKKSVHFSANRFVGRKESAAPPTLGGAAAGVLNKKNSPKNSENSLGK